MLTRFVDEVRDRSRPDECSGEAFRRIAFAFPVIGVSVRHREINFRASDIQTSLEDAMKSLAKKVQRFLVSEDGPTAVEYAVMLALIIIVCLTAIRAIGQQTAGTFQSVAAEL